MQVQEWARIQSGFSRLDVYMWIAANEVLIYSIDLISFAIDQASHCLMQDISEGASRRERRDEERNHVYQ